jgi:hypothetical protein
MNKQTSTTKERRQTAPRTRHAAELSASRKEIRRAALVAGFGLLAMAIIAGLANFGAVEAVLVDGDAAATAQNLAESRTTFLLGVVGFGLVAVLDVIIAWALHVFFRPSSPRLSAVAAVVRIVYGGFLAVATVQLAGALNANTDAETLRSIETFQDTWNAGLVLFGSYLVLISWLACKTVRVPNWVALFVAVTGVGYLIDAIGTLSSETYSADITTFTFIGELVLMFWLLIKGRAAEAQRSIHPTTETRS